MEAVFVDGVGGESPFDPYHSCIVWNCSIRSRSFASRLIWMPTHDQIHDKELATGCLSRIDYTHLIQQSWQQSRR